MSKIETIMTKNRKTYKLKNDEKKFKFTTLLSLCDIPYKALKHEGYTAIEVYADENQAVKADIIYNCIK